MTRGAPGYAATALLVLVPLAAGCGEPASPRAEAKLPGLRGATAIELSHRWVGLSPVSPTEADYRLERRGQEFQGSARFQAGMQALRKEAFESVIVPAAAAAEFLAALERVPVREAELDPKSPPGQPIVKLPPSAIPRMTDHYPSTTITILRDDRTITFSSTSQDPSGRPWVVALGSRMYVSDSGATGQAFDVLRAHLRWDRYSKVQAEVMADWERSKAGK